MAVRRSRSSAGRSSRVGKSRASWSARIRAAQAGCPFCLRISVDALALLVEPAAFALANALRVARAEALSVTDDLTQLYNSRYLNDALRKETKRAMRGGWPLSLLFIDLDGFKQINDVHGHLLGSRALDRGRPNRPRPAPAKPTSSPGLAATNSRFSCRKPGLDGGPRRGPAHPSTASSATSSWPTMGPGNRISASIGLATLPDVADTAEGLLQAADAAMYRVKVSGKNGIHVAGMTTARSPTPDRRIGSL